MRLIDADAIVYKNGGWTDEYEIDHMPTISPTPNWTPCSAGLPEDQSDVLIYFDRCGGEIGIGYYAERADGVKFWCATGSMLCYNVLAWQPLPEPYRGEA